MVDLQPETLREQIAELLQEFYVNEHRDIYDTVDAVLDLIPTGVYPVEETYNILRQLYLHGANREKNESGWYKSHTLENDYDEKMEADIRYAYKQLGKQD